MFEGIQQISINKNFPLLSDGEFLYIIGKKIINQGVKEKKVQKLIEEKAYMPKECTKLQQQQQLKMDILYQQQLLLQIQQEQKKQLEEIAGQRREDGQEEKFEEISEEELLQQQQLFKMHQLQQIQQKQEILQLIQYKGKNLKRKRIIINQRLIIIIERLIALIKNCSYQKNQEVGQKNIQEETDIQNKDIDSNYNRIIEYCLYVYNIEQQDEHIVRQQQTITQQYTYKSKTILGQAEITTDISKAIKNTADISVKDNSLILPANVASSFWTMNKDQISLYSEQGIKIFSKKPEDVYEINPYSYFKSLEENNIENSDINNKDKPQKLLKTTLITKINVNKKAYPLNPAFHGCYDIQNNIYYILNWSINNQNCEFPSLISMVSEQKSYINLQYHKYVENLIEKNDTNNQQQQQENYENEFEIKFMSKILSLQKFRQQIVWKLNKWEYTYGYALQDIQVLQQINQSQGNKKQNIEETKNILLKQKQKIIQKMNKYLEQNKLNQKNCQKNEKILIEITKEYAFCINGSIQQFLVIFEKINNLYQNNQFLIDEKKIFLSLIQLLYWVLHCDVLSIQKKEICDKFGKIFEVLVTFIQFFQEKNKIVLELISHIFSQGWNLFNKSNSQQITVFKKLLEIKNKEFNFFELLYKNQGFSCKTIQLDMQFKDIQLIEYIQNKSDLLEQVDMQTNFAQIFAKNKQIRVNQQMFCQPFCLLLIEEIDYLKNLKSEYIEEDEEVKDNEQDIQEENQNYFTQKIFGNYSEGIDQVIEKVFETNHPYERGKVIQFEQNIFPGAIAIAVHFDKRCQSDTANDFLSIQAWYDNQKSTNNQMGSFSYQQKEGLGKYFKISGKNVPKKLLILLGNSIQVDFQSSGHAKDEKSLSRWGYKINVRPIYGMNKKMWQEEIQNEEDFIKLKIRFGNEEKINDWLNTMKLCAISIIESKKKTKKKKKMMRKQKNKQSKIQITKKKNQINFYQKISFKDLAEVKAKPQKLFVILETYFIMKTNFNKLLSKFSKLANNTQMKIKNNNSSNQLISQQDQGLYKKINQYIIKWVTLGIIEKYQFGSCGYLNYYEWKQQFNVESIRLKQQQQQWVF
ncbi:hypothetical protein IMG5_100520 [Ichthyophthirius multifiliis]|uniref:Uncharacterized protein n=1 Tax=Ichthyophthirius multifiliis TaxID=5932 RepID=G0QSA4_ICHMU|nr:hypothetical protein IMG5_100520 [Ichthyophthirius multifiliis]EGR31902.1 hypothetical protein IMG5_100520 [Ichthyophthirius multifiliis]|eukprot:XP_004035388.1 hypothetical protein IMG5_100520 [Ichthyophthirius multifiliis]